MKVTKRIIMIILFIIVMFSIFVLCLRPKEKDWKKVKEITEETYKELQETDEMYGHLPYEAQVSEIYVDQKLGDAYVYVRITVPEENADEFEVWLNNAEKQFGRKQNVFYFSYFVGDSHTQFGEYEERNNWLER